MGLLVAIEKGDEKRRQSWEGEERDLRLATFVSARAFLRHYWVFDPVPLKRGRSPGAIFKERVFLGKGKAWLFLDLPKRGSRDRRKHF